jgi:methyl-accepting chemotaxis protein
MHLTNLKISSRLLISAILPVCLFVFFSIWMWMSLGGMRDDVTIHLTQQLETTLNVKDMDYDVVQVQQFLSDISATRGKDGLDDGFKRAEESRAGFLKKLSAFETLAKKTNDQKVSQALSQLRQDFDAYYAAGLVMAKAFVEGGPEKGNALMKPFDKASDALQTSMKLLVEDATHNIHSEVKGVSDEAQLLRLTALGLCAVAMVITLLLSSVISRSIVRPLDAVVHALDAIAQGDLSHPIAVHGSDEISQLLQSSSAMQQQLASVVAHVRQSSEGVATASAEIAQGNQDLSARTESQASALEETAASMEQLNATVKHNAENAHQANQLALNASTIAVYGGEMVTEVVQTMKHINDSSKRIFDIIGVIDGIAFQTNILALNAAVEAARAGEQGRGFAVVATEVRSLAGRSAAAAKEIKTLIGESVARVTQGTALVDQTGSTMQEIVVAIQRVTDIMGQISSASSEQSEGVSQVGEAVMQMDQVTQQNAALVEEMAAAAASLRSQAQELVQTVAVFKLSGIADNAPSSRALTLQVNRFHQ